MRKYITELNKEELTAVFHANSKLQSDVADDMVETEGSYLQEQMQYLKKGLADWSLGAYGYNYLTISQERDFITAVEELEKAVPILIDSDLPILERAIKARDEFYYLDMDSDEWDEKQEEEEQAADELKERVLYRINQRFSGCYDKENQLDYFLDFYVHERLDQDCYIEEGSYKLYKDVSYTKTFE